MRVRSLLLLLALPLIPWLAVAEEPASLPESQAASDIEDLIYFGEQHPVVLRLHLRIDGRPFRAVWDEYLTHLFHFLDRDGDGFLNKKEAEQVPRAQTFRDLLRGGNLNMTPGRVTFSQLDNHPADGKVSLEELQRYYRRFGVTALQVNFVRVHGPSVNPLTDALFGHLDANRDGKLSREELQQAAQVLNKLDLDDDEMISPQELSPQLAPPMDPRAEMMGQENSDRSLTYFPDDALFARIRPGESPARIAELLLSHYDKDNDQKLSRAEIGLTEARFHDLDTNRDGQLEASELGRLVALPPDVELDLRFNRKPAALGVRNSLFNPVGLLAGFGRTAMAGLPLTVRAPTEGRGAGGVTLQRTGPDGLVVTLPGAQVDLQHSAGSRERFESFRESVLQQFKDALSSSKDYVEEKALQNPQYQALRALFPLADRNGDGKLTREELNAMLDLHAEGITSSLLLTLYDHDRDLFGLIDTNQDGLLGQRELRQAWSKLAPWDRNGDGQIDRNEIPRKFHIQLGQGQPGSMNAALAPVARTGYPVTPKPISSGRGPLWFRKMDRNGDGDVSLREFLGSLEDFKRIDADGDGLIDAEEADRADAWFRNRASPKP